MDSYCECIPCFHRSVVTPLHSAVSHQIYKEKRIGFCEKNLATRQGSRIQQIKVVAMCTISTCAMLVLIGMDMTNDANELKELNLLNVAFSDIINKVQEKMHLLIYKNARFLRKISNCSETNGTSEICANSSAILCFNDNLELCNSTPCQHKGQDNEYCAIDLFMLSSENIFALVNISKEFSMKMQESISFAIGQKQTHGINIFLYKSFLITEMCFLDEVAYTSLVCLDQGYSFLLGQLNENDVHLFQPRLNDLRNFELPLFIDHSFNDLLQNYTAISLTAFKNDINKTAIVPLNSFLAIAKDIHIILRRTRAYLEEIILAKLLATRKLLITRLALKCSVLIFLFFLIVIIMYTVSDMNNWIFQYASQLQSKTDELEQEKRMTENLLYQMLPRSVANQLRNRQAVDAELFESVSIFFSDIVGFTNISANCTPMQVISMLNNLYSTFDERIDTYDVYKVETIGDAYMVASGVPERNGGKHVDEIATMAIDLLAAIKQVKTPNEENGRLRIRIGIHTDILSSFLGEDGHAASQRGSGENY